MLPLYIVVMMAHQTQENVVAENLEAFLGTNAADFTSWWAPVAQPEGPPFAVVFLSACESDRAVCRARAMFLT